MTTYAEKLKHPLWQRMRLEILERDHFACRACGNKEITLHVHHLRYIARRAPWECKTTDLITLCENCHDVEHAEKQQAESFLVSAFRGLGATGSELFYISGMIESFEPKRQLSKEEFRALAERMHECIEAMING